MDGLAEGAGAGAGPDPVGAPLRVLDALDPETGARLRGLLPRPDSTFGVALALFLATVDRGARAWLGPATGDLDALGGGALVDAADEALAPRRIVTGEAAWTVRTVPVDASLPSAGGTEDWLWATAEGSTGPRFVLQGRLPVLGIFQVRGTLAEEMLGVIVQTAGPLPPDLRIDMEEGFEAVLAAEGWRGWLRAERLTGAWIEFGHGLHADSTA